MWRIIPKNVDLTTTIPHWTTMAFLTNPANNWAGITNAIRTEVDFDKANIEYVEFWLLDPFITY